MPIDEFLADLAQLHYSHNLSAWLDYRKRMIDLGYDIKVDEGQTEVSVPLEGMPNYVGALIVSDGIEVLPELKKEKNQVGDGYNPDTTPVPTRTELSDYLIKNAKDPDMAYFYDGQQRTITDVKKYNNSLPTGLSLKALERMAPEDIKNKSDTRAKVGLKTHLALEMPQAYGHVDAYLIKRSAYNVGDMGFPILMHVYNGGMELVHFESDGHWKEESLQDALANVRLVHRTYELRDGKMELVGSPVIYKDPKAFWNPEPRRYAPLGEPERRPSYMPVLAGGAY